MKSETSNPVRIAICTIALMVATCLLAYVAAEDHKATTRFWLALLPVIAAELMLCGTAILASREDKEKLVRRSAISVVPAGYFLFSIGMAVFSRLFPADIWYGTVQIVGLVATLILASASSMAAEASERDESKTERALQARRQWHLDLQMATDLASTFFPDQPDIVREMARAAEKARFSPETLLEHEEFDDPVHAAVQVLCSAVSQKNAESVQSAIAAFHAAATLRERRIRNSR